MTNRTKPKVRQPLEPLCVRPEFHEVCLRASGLTVSGILHDPNLERFIGGLTAALGIGALIPRTGPGLYGVLEQSGDRLFWSMILLSLGCWALVLSYFEMPKIRTTVLIMIFALWCNLIYKFLSAQLWGAALQGLVVMVFTSFCIVRIFNWINSGKR